MTLWSSLRARTVAVSIAPRARGGSPTKLRRISSWVPRSRVSVRLARGPAPGTLQLKVKFSPTGCQGGRGISSTRSGRSARDQNLGSSAFRTSLGRKDQRMSGWSFGGVSRDPRGVPTQNLRKVRMSPRAWSVRRAQRKKQTGWVSGSRMSTSCRASQRRPLWVPFRRSEVSKPPRSGRGQLVLQLSHSEPPRSTSATRG